MRGEAEAEDEDVGWGVGSFTGLVRRGGAVTLPEHRRRIPHVRSAQGLWRIRRRWTPESRSRRHTPASAHPPPSAAGTSPTTPRQPRSPSNRRATNELLPVNHSPFLSRIHVLRTLLVSLAMHAVAALLPAQSTPTLPPAAQALQVPAGNVVSWHVHALGVQVYRFDAATGQWTFVSPAAVLFADAGCHFPVGLHYTGPTWQSLGGSTVVGQRLAGATVDANAIPWLLLGAVSTTGPGVLAPTTYVQRTNTAGGLAPTRVGFAGETVWVPYAADYWFYRAQ